MPFEIVDPAKFGADGRISEKLFFEKIKATDWTIFKGKTVLVRGCGDLLVPPWAFMAITAELMPYARAIRYGNEHDNVTIGRNRAAK